MDGRVLVTGGCGFIGHHLVHRLAAAGYRITVLDDFSTGARDSLCEDDDIRVVEGSVLDPAAVRRAAVETTAVVHLAGVVGMRLAANDGARAYRVSVEGTRHVLAATGDAPAVLFSSSAVYGLATHDAVAEHDVPDAAAMLAYDGGARGYACGKWELEQQARAAARAGRRILIVRPFNVVGEGQTAVYGMVVPRFVGMARRGEPLVVYDDGAQSRAFSDVRTFVDALLRLTASRRAWEVPDHAVNIGAAESTTIGALARMVLEETGSEAPVRHVAYREIFPGRRDVRARVPDTTRLHDLIGPVEWPALRSVVQRLAQVNVASAVSEPS